MDNKKIDQIFNLLSHHTTWKISGYPVNEIKKRCLPDESIESISFMIDYLKSEGLVDDKENITTAYAEGYILSEKGRSIAIKIESGSITEYLTAQKLALSESSKKALSQQNRIRRKKSARALVKYFLVGAGAVIGWYFTDEDLFVSWLTRLGIIE